jgi:hypothetical protein
MLARAPLSSELIVHVRFYCIQSKEVSSTANDTDTSPRQTRLIHSRGATRHITFSIPHHFERTKRDDATTAPSVSAG